MGDGGGLTLTAGSGKSPTIARGATISFAEHADNTLGVDTNKLTINGAAYQLIYTMAQLDLIDGELATVSGVLTSAASGKYALARDLTAPSTAYSRALVAKLENGGVFDGLGHGITGLKINDSTNFRIGLFGGSVGATIRNLALVGVEVSVSAGSSIGGLIGEAQDSVIDNVSVSGLVDARVSYAGSQAGGLAGSFRTQYSSASISNSFADVVVIGKAGAGGLIGSLAPGKPITISRSYAIGNVTGFAAGGFIGGFTNTSSVTLMDVFALGDVTGTGLNADAKEPSLPRGGWTSTLFYLPEQDHRRRIIQNHRNVSIIDSRGISVIKSLMTGF